MKTEEQQIESLSRCIIEIELRKDADALATFVTEDYIGVDPSGALMTKGDTLERYRSQDFRLAQIEISESSISVMGNTAFELGIMTLQGRIGSHEFTGRYRCSHLWVKEVEGWKVRASQLTPLMREAARSPEA